VAFLQSCRDYYETQTHIFIHACYDPALPMTQQLSPVLLWDSLRDLIPAHHVSGKTVILGHTAQKSGEILDLAYLTGIVTYCYGGGWLTALEVATGQVWQANKRGVSRR